MGKRREKQWVGGSKLVTPETDAGTTVANIVRLVEPIPLADVQGKQSKCLIEAIYLHFSVRRAGAGQLAAPDALGFMVYLQQVSETSDLPLQALDSLSLQARAYGNANILMWSNLPVPPLLGTSDLLAFAPSDEVMTDHHDYQANRKFDRAGQVLCMTINSDISLVVRVFAQWRVLLSYA